MRIVARIVSLSLVCACLAPVASRAGDLNLATLSCDRYENEIVGTADVATPDVAQPADAPQAAQRPDAINLVMWLFGFSVARSGDHHMYGDALTSFGFALDAQCRNNPRASVLEAAAAVSPKRDQPMDLTVLNCGTFETRHFESAQKDPESARTIMMWLYGFTVGLSGRHIFDPGGFSAFTTALQSECTEHPNDSLFDSLSAVARPAKR